MSHEIIKPKHNTVNGRDAWDLMREIAEGNPAFDKTDAVFLALMFKHIPRAGRKSYDPSNTQQEDKLLDLEKSAVYLNEWIATVKETIPWIDTIYPKVQKERPKKIVVTMDDEVIKQTSLVANTHIEGVIAREMIRAHLYSSEEMVPSLTRFRLVGTTNVSSRKTIYTVEFEDNYWWVVQEDLSYTIVIDDPFLEGDI